MTSLPPLFLAPMAGAGDRAFRETCAMFSPAAFFSEMISAKALLYQDRRTRELASFGEAERPFYLQLFGHEPEEMARAAKLLVSDYAPDGLDLNFGCPVPKIAGNGDGSALMRTPVLCGQIVQAVVEAVSCPVSVKLRAGWDADSINAPEVARLCEKSGASRITVHARTRSDFYRDGTLRAEVIGEVKKAVGVPVVGNGDVRDAKSALTLCQYGPDALMIGRAAVGAPWIFQTVRDEAEGRTGRPFSKKAIIESHVERAFRYKPQTAGREMRMHMSHYLKGFRGAAELRDAASRAETPRDYLNLIALLPETKP